MVQKNIKLNTIMKISKLQKILKISIIIILTLICSCRQETKQKVDLSKYEESLIKANKFLLKKDEERIISYIKRKEWDMLQTKTGLWYMIYETTDGEKSKPNDIVSIKFSVELLDGTECYNSDSVGLKKFKIGKTDVESGLNEGILLLKEGEKARLILPPYMAHGLIGDEYKIPSRATIIYNVELIEILN